MIELAPLPESADIELEGGFSLIPCPPEYPGSQEFVMWDGEAIVGGMVFNPEDDLTAEVWLGESLSPDSSQKAMSALSDYAFEQTGVNRITTAVDVSSDKYDSDTLFLEAAGFRLAEINHAYKINTYELIKASLDKKGQRITGFYFLPVRVTLSGSDLPTREPKERPQIGDKHSDKIDISSRMHQIE